MHVHFDQNNADTWLEYYAVQAAQNGYGLDGFTGYPYQRGGGLGNFFRSLFKMAVPIFKSMGKQVGKHALTAGANIAEDIVRGRPLFESAKEHARTETSKLLRQASDALQEGEGLGYRPKSINNEITDTFSKLYNNGTNRRQIKSKHKKRA